MWSGAIASGFPYAQKYLSCVRTDATARLGADVDRCTSSLTCPARQSGLHQRVIASSSV